jgi:FAD/FMN-containing dehydrogenase
MKAKLRQLRNQLEGELYDDQRMRILYATDASAYREMPLAVAIPKGVGDIKKLIAFARAEKTSLIPRTAWHLSCRSGCWAGYCGRCIETFYKDH